MLFYIDTDDGRMFIRDDEGVEFLSLNEACAATLALLPEIARDAVHSSSQRAEVMKTHERCIAAQVRDEAGQILFHARLRLDMDWPSRQNS